MAIGDTAKKQGYALVPGSGEEGRVHWGSREINRTRDYIAAVLKSIPTTAASWRSHAGFTSLGYPTVEQDGDITFVMDGF